MMIKTQVQIPDDLFERAKQVAADKECSFAKVVRRGLEHMTRVNPPRRRPPAEWSLPGPFRLGPFLAPEEEWTKIAHDERN